MRDWLTSKNPLGPFPELLALLVIIGGYVWGFMSKEMRIISAIGCLVLIVISCFSCTLITMTIIGQIGR